MKTRLKELSYTGSVQAITDYWKGLSSRKKGLAIGILVALGTWPLWLWCFKGAMVMKGTAATVGGVETIVMTQVPASLLYKLGWSTAFAVITGWFAQGAATSYHKSFEEALQVAKPDHQEHTVLSEDELNALNNDNYPAGVNDAIIDGQS